MNERTNAKALADQLQPHTYPARLRGDGTIEAWFTFKRAAGAYPLGWVIDADKGRLRRLLDYDGWLYCDMTPAAILAAVEESERQVTRRAWPDMPEYWCTGVAK